MGLAPGKAQQRLPGVLKTRGEGSALFWLGEKTASCWEAYPLMGHPLKGLDYLLSFGSFKNQKEELRGWCYIERMKHFELLDLKERNHEIVIWCNCDFIYQNWQCAFLLLWFSLGIVITWFLVSEVEMWPMHHVRPTSIRVLKDLDGGMSSSWALSVPTWGVWCSEGISSLEFGLIKEMWHRTWNIFTPMCAQYCRALKLYTYKDKNISGLGLIFWLILFLVPLHCWIPSGVNTMFYWWQHYSLSLRNRQSLQVKSLIKWKLLRLLRGK